MRSLSFPACPSSLPVTTGGEECAGKLLDESQAPSGLPGSFGPLIPHQQYDSTSAAGHIHAMRKRRGGGRRRCLCHPPHSQQPCAAGTRPSLRGGAAAVATAAMRTTNDGSCHRHQRLGREETTHAVSATAAATATATAGAAAPAATTRRPPKPRRHREALTVNTAGGAPLPPSMQATPRSPARGNPNKARRQPGHASPGGGEGGGGLASREAVCRGGACRGWPPAPPDAGAVSANRRLWQAWAARPPPPLTVAVHASRVDAVRFLRLPFRRCGGRALTAEEDKALGVWARHAAHPRGGCVASELRRPFLLVPLYFFAFPPTLLPPPPVVCWWLGGHAPTLLAHSLRGCALPLPSRHTTHNDWPEAAATGQRARVGRGTPIPVVAGVAVPCKGPFIRARQSR